MKIGSIILLVLCFVLLLSLAVFGVPQTQQAALPPEEESVSDEGSPAEVITEEPAQEPEEEAQRPEDLPDIDINSWEFIIANSYNSISEYIPEYGAYDGQGIDERIIDATDAFIMAARDAGYSVYLSAAYRNFSYILNEFLLELVRSGNAYEAAKVYSPPGVNEHQTGLCIDLTDQAMYRNHYGEFDNEAFRETEAYQWLVEHCHEYGFILRYPEGREDIYGTPCQAGHFRYVGVEAATYIMEHDLTLEEFVALYDEDAVYMPNKKAA